MQLGKDLFKRQPIKRWEGKPQICLPKGGRVRDNIEKQVVWGEEPHYLQEVYK